MSDINRILDDLVSSRSADPLAITTVIVPSRLAALQLRRRMAAKGAFAGVRFETLARLAELIAASSLARSAKTPLARPIADYVATRIARESRAPLEQVRDIPGYARALRQTFRRLRRGGFHDGRELLQTSTDGAGLEEIARLFTRFREDTAAFYDDEDLIEAATAVIRASPRSVLPELGDVFVVPPSRLTAASSAFLDLVRDVCPSYVEVDDVSGAPEERFILAPDSATESRGIVKSILDDLEHGVRLDEIAVFLSGDRAYRRLIEQTLEAASLPAAVMPGTPLIETPAGQGALGLAKLALEDYSRTSVFDFLGLAPLRRFLPIGSERVRLDTTNWQRIATEAGVTRGINRWRESLEIYLDDQRQRALPTSDEPDWRRERAQRAIRNAESLGSVIEHLHQTLTPLARQQPAATFIPPFKRLIETWFDPETKGLEQVLNEVDQLGTIDSVAGSFDLASFVDAFESNLSLAAVRGRSLGDGILVSDHSQAAGLQFRRVYLCGAYEGALPAVATSEPLIQDEVWARLKETHPHVEDLALRSQRSIAAVQRVAAAADTGRLTWSAPTQAAGAAREHYPSPLMTEAARRKDPALASAADLRRAPSSEWLSRLPSPLAGMLTGLASDTWELRLRETVELKRKGGSIMATHPLAPAVELIEARRSHRFTAFDGNLAALEGRAAPKEGGYISPSALETFATCGMRYLYGQVLRLRPVDKPEENQTMGAAEKGSLVHHVLQLFFEQQKALGRPAANERWNEADTETLLEIFEEEFEKLRKQGRAGLDIYMNHDRNLLRADLATFLDRDSDYRIDAGVIPDAFEPRLEAPALAGLNFVGYIDRVDRSADGKKAVIIDYKTGSASRYKSDASDPFKGGQKLQLPIYALAADGAEEVRALYWFISGTGAFEMVDYTESPEYRQRFEATVQSIIEAIHKGVFPAVPGEEDDFRNSFDNCRYCDFTRICSRRRVYESVAKADDPDVVAWFDVAKVARGEPSS